MRYIIVRDGVLVLGALSLLSQCVGGFSNGVNGTRELNIWSRQAAAANGPIGHWAAMGDSYSAGPGAGEAYDHIELGKRKCYRSKGSAAGQLDAQNIVKLGNFQFLSCTGHKIEDMVQYQLPLLDYGEQDIIMWLSLSIGGNNLAFGKYARACLVGFGSCNKAQKEAENLIYDLDKKQTFRRLLEDAWSRIYTDDHFRNIPPGQVRYVPNTLQTLYPAFFNSETDDCEDGTVIPGVGPKLTKGLRRKTNGLVRDANNAIRTYARAFVRSPQGRYHRGRLHTVDYDNTFEQHRLCENFTGKKPGFDNPRVWFLGIASDAALQESDLSVPENPATCNPNADDVVEALRCVMALVDAAGDDPDAIDELSLPLGFVKAFHPKAAGFQQVMNLHFNHWVLNQPYLRVLALGDSITNGFRSTDNAGYRSRFYELASTIYGQQVDMIGSVRSGDVGDADHEGHNGATINQISSYADQDLGQRPNVVLLHAGTNDMSSDADAQGAVDRLVALVDKIIAKCPDATVLVARITPADDAARQARTNAFNDGIEAAMRSRADGGAKVQIMYMDLMVTRQTLADGLHPNDIGYFAMAEHWWGGVLQAYNDGWLKDPVDGDGPGPVRDICPQDPTWLPQGEIANGAGLGANLFVKSTCFMNPVSETCNCQELDTPTALTQELLDSTDECKRRALNTTLDTAVHFADLNGDGRSEYLWVADNGAVTAFLNLGSASGGANAGKVKWASQGVIASGVGGKRANVQFADLNGDGRAEYLRVNDDGSVECWLNAGGQDDGPNAAKITWIPQGTIALGIGKDGAGVRFADLNGDGRAEYLYVNTDGSVEAYLNLGSTSGGANAGKVAWASQGTIASGVGVGRDSTVFADINGDGRADYIALSRTDGSARLWLNAGGPDNGLNAAKVVWLPQGTIANGVGGSGRGVQFADLNGDSRAEYIDVKFDTSAVSAWLNGC